MDNRRPSYFLTDEVISGSFVRLLGSALIDGTEGSDGDETNHTF